MPRVNAATRAAVIAHANTAKREVTNLESQALSAATGRAPSARSGSKPASKKERQRPRPESTKGVAAKNPFGIVSPETPLRNRMSKPSARFGAGKYTAASFHKANSSYYKSIVDPVTSRGARIPDAQVMPSVVFSMEKTGTFYAGALGCGILGFGINAWNQLGPVVQDGGTPWDYQTLLIPTAQFSYEVDAPTTALGELGASWAVGVESGENSTPTNLFAGITSQSWIKFLGWDEHNTEVPTMVEKARLVSAKLMMTPQDTALATKGRMIGVSMPRGATSPLVNDATNPLAYTYATYTLDYFQNYPGARFLACNQSEAINVIYKPQDPISWQYADIALGPGYSPGAICFARPQAANLGLGNVAIPVGGYTSLDELDKYAPGVLAVLVDGCTPGQAFQWKVVLNYEALPRQAQVCLLDAEVSKHDPIDAAMTMNAVAETPAIAQGNKDAVPPVESVQRQNFVKPEPAPQQPIMEKVIETVLGAGKSVVNNAGPLLPLAAALL